MINITGLDYKIGDKVILKNISLEFEKGKIYGIIGPNGAGKSTLLKHIMSIINPPKGTIFYDRQDITTISVKDYAKRVSFVFQENVRTVDFTVKEILLMGKYSYMDIWGNLPKEVNDEIDKILELLDILNIKYQSIATLSGGEAQKVFIARAILQDTPVILLDEPTSMLDLANSAYILECLSKLNKQKLITVIMVMHDLNLAAQSCHKLILMSKGEAIYEGSPKEVLKSDILNTVYGNKLYFIKDKDKEFVVPKIN